MVVVILSACSSCGVANADTPKENHDVEEEKGHKGDAYEAVVGYCQVFVCLLLFWQLSRLKDQTNHLQVLPVKVQSGQGQHYQHSHEKVKFLSATIGLSVRGQ